MSNTMHSEIAKQAYFLWLQDGMLPGRAEQHWVAAEKLVAKRKMTPRKAKKPKLNS